jgi:hypothetical protein
MTQCSPLKINRRFGETYLCFHGRRLSRTINMFESRCQAEALVSCSVVVRSCRWKRYSSPKRPFFMIRVVGISNESVSVWTSPTMMRAAEARDWHEDRSYIFLRNAYLYLEVKQSFCGAWQYGVDRILSVSSESPALSLLRLCTDRHPGPSSNEACQNSELWRVAVTWQRRRDPAGA